MKTPRTLSLGSLVLLVALIAGGCSIVGPTLFPPDAGVTSPPGGGGGVAPGEPRPQLVIPRPGQLNVHLVAITKLTVTVSAGAGPPAPPARGRRGPPRGRATSRSSSSWGTPGSTRASASGRPRATASFRRPLPGPTPPSWPSRSRPGAAT